MEDLEKIAWGWTSSVYDVPGEEKVVKVLDKNNRKALYERELAAYERMTARENVPRSIMKFFGSPPCIEYGLVFEFVDGGNLIGYLRHCKKHREPPQNSQLLLWAEQLTEALEFVHSCGIIHCDIHAANCFLTENLDLKLGDFGGSGIDGKHPLLMYRRDHQLWIFDDETQKWTRAESVASDIFAVGCTLYNMETLKEPFHWADHDKDKELMAKKLQQKDMPELDECPVLGPYIAKCWNQEYASASTLLADVRAEIAKSERDSSNGPEHVEL